MEGLALGTYFLSCRTSVGWTMTSWNNKLQTGPKPLMDRAEQWLKSWFTDPDMARDVRMMIPGRRGPQPRLTTSTGPSPACG